MTLTYFHPSLDCLIQIIKVYKNNDIVPFRGTKTTVEEFYELHLKNTIQNSLLMAINAKQEGFIFFVFNVQKMDISTVKNIILKATPIFD